MTNPEKSAKGICDMLFFRGLLEILKVMMENYNKFLNPEKGEKLIVNNLVKRFVEYNEFPKLFDLKLNKKNEKDTQNMIKEKVEKFINDYIHEKINITISHAHREPQENREKKKRRKI